MIPHVEIRIERCEAEVWFNDFPIHRVAATESPVFLTKPVAEFVCEGDNVLTLIPFPGETPSTSRISRPIALPEGARIEANLIFYEEGDFPGSGAGQQAITVRIPDGETAVSLPALSVSRRKSLKLGIAPWEWQRAKPLVLGGESGGLVNRAVADAHAAFARRDAEFFLKFGRIYFTEYARAYPGMPPERREQRFRAGFAALSEDWSVVSLDADAFDFRICANGRLVEIINRDFKPTLSADSMFYPFQMFLGVLDSGLQMIR